MSTYPDSTAVWTLQEYGEDEGEAEELDSYTDYPDADHRL